jgi:sulfate transport system ATP-binding protein
VVDSRGGGVAARISRILAFGVTARVELDGLNGSTGQIFEVEITRDEVAPGPGGRAGGASGTLAPERFRT